MSAIAIKSFAKDETCPTHLRPGLEPLQEQELQQVQGGLLPFIAAAYSVATGYAVRSFAGYVAHRATTIYGVFSAAKHYGGGENYGGSGRARDGS
jgi:lactobin A/cerein 7B family class IIb bacteriocin